jgi:hypothetical protein
MLEDASGLVDPVSYLVNIVGYIAHQEVESF